MDNYNKLLKRLNNHSSDIKAEMIISCLLEAGISMNQIIVFLNGQHKRSWSKDVSTIETLKLKDGEEKIVLNLNQDGIFDSLPEALFHSNIHDKADAGKEMAEESMKLKIEEKEIRNFFIPFENAIYSTKVNLTLKENTLLNKLHSNLLQGVIPNFWDIDASVPEKYTKNLISLLPLSHKIIGNFDLTAQSLSYILHEKIEISIEDPHKYFSGGEIQEFQLASLGACSLGVDFICGSDMNGVIGQINIIIGPINNISIEECLNNGYVKKLINCFCNYFVPYEIDVTTEFVFKDEYNNLIMSDDSNNSYLGLNTVL